MYSRGSEVFFLVSKSKVTIPRYYLGPQNFLEEIMKYVFKKLLLISFLFSGLFLSSCEDDALLAPQSGDTDDGGSYGNLSFPTDPKKNKTLNPETF